MPACRHQKAQGALFLSPTQISRCREHEFARPFGLRRLFHSEEGSPVEESVAAPNLSLVSHQLRELRDDRSRNDGGGRPFQQAASVAETVFPRGERRAFPGHQLLACHSRGRHVTQDTPTLEFAPDCQTTEGHSSQGASWDLTDISPFLPSFLLQDVNKAGKGGVHTIAAVS